MRPETEVPYCRVAVTVRTNADDCLLTNQFLAIVAVPPSPSAAKGASATALSNAENITSLLNNHISLHRT